MVFVEFIQEHRWWVLAISLPLILIYGRVLVLAALGGSAPSARPATTPIRRLPPKPQPGGMVKPSGMTPPPEGRQEVLPSSLDAGVSGHQKAGSAKTVKLPATPSKPTDSPLTAKKPTTGGDAVGDSDADAMEGLFGKRDEPAIPSETPSVALRRKASRMEELGFHHGIITDQLPTDLSKVPAATPVAPTAPATPTTAAASTPIIPGSDGAPRSSTAELTSILERIDKFLAEDTPSKPTTTLPPAQSATTAVVKADAVKTAEPSADSSAKATESMAKPEDKVASAKPDPNKKTQPMWARADAQDEDIDTPPKSDKKPEGDQQRLF
ncbi:MAG TPA: hypothetical protein VHX44_07220 [Planctomycetota bacterium]|jgi:hypothetical protein|nr:hypothetical protein [Planctomycetota bacterium]